MRPTKSSFKGNTDLAAARARCIAYWLANPTASSYEVADACGVSRERALYARPHSLRWITLRDRIIFDKPKKRENA